jgi:hypothetical protein
MGYGQTPFFLKFGHMTIRLEYFGLSERRMEMDIHWMEFFLLILASFRVTRLIVFDQITEFFRKIFLEEVEEQNKDGQTEIYIVPKSGKIRGFIGELISCYWCTGVWVAIFLTFLYYFFPAICEPVVLIFAIAGGASLLEAILQRVFVE